MKNFKLAIVAILLGLFATDPSLAETRAVDSSHTHGLYGVIGDARHQSSAGTPGVTGATCTHVGRDRYIDTTTAVEYYCSAADTWVELSPSAAAAPSFADVTAGTNTAALLVGTGGTLAPTGSGTVTASDLSCTDCIGETEIAALDSAAVSTGTFAPSRIDGIDNAKCARFDASGTLIAASGDCASGDTGGGDAPGGNDGEMQYRVNGTTLGGVGNLESDGTDPILVTRTTNPSAPSAGTSFYAFAPVSGWPSVPLVAMHKPAIPIPIGLAPTFTQSQGWHCALPFGFGGTGMATYGVTNSSTGTATSIAHSPGTLVGRLQRLLYRSAASTNSSSGLRASNDQAYRGNAAGIGGFYFTTAFGIDAAQANMRFALVLNVGTGAISATIDPSTFTNFVGFYCDSGQTTMRVGANDSSGTVASPTDLGSDFPCATSGAYYEAALWAEPNASDISYAIRRIDTSVTPAAGTVPSSDGLPGATGLLSWDIYANTASGSTAVDLGFAGYCFVAGL